MYLSLFKTLCMTEKQRDKLYQFNFVIWFSVALLTGLGLLIELIRYLINK
jgi:hypothetical protein